ncbi:MAG: hypothetical protein QM775_31335 [Pirellulales bacterium]
MAKQKSSERLPIKVVLATDDDYPELEKPNGGSFDKFPTPDDFREDLLGGIAQVTRYFSSAFRKWPDVPAIAKVTLRSDAIAKTYRPTPIFNQETCPIVGESRLGELYISVTPHRLERLSIRVKEKTQEAERYLSTVTDIAPFRKVDAITHQGQASTYDLAEAGEPLRLRLFNHGSAAANSEVLRAAKTLCNKVEIESASEAPYGRSLTILRLAGVSRRAARTIAGFPGTQSLTGFPTYRAARTTSVALKALPIDTILPPEPNREYPTVLLIDSGTDRRNVQLQKWVSKRWDFVKRPRQDNDHGSFVAGLLCQAKRLNGDDPAFPSCASKIIDVVAIDETERITEFLLVTVIFGALKKFPDARIVNLSLSIENEVCEDDKFSSLAVALDGFSRQFGVRFAVPTGNYDDISCTWPRQVEIGSADRVLSPADAILGVSTGSIAHLENHKTTVRIGEPSPFTRGGPGPAYVPSPLLVHNGGNMDENGEYFRTGVVSIDGKGNLAEDAGVSFSNPLIATLYANLQHELSNATDNAFCISKGFLVHSAILEQLPIGDRFDYCGFGRPGDLDDMISCEQSAATVVFQARLAGDKKRFSKPKFPMPQCLVADGSLNCEILMTLVYEPPLDASFGCAYCRINVDAALGTVRGGKFQTEVDPIPKRRTAGYEQDLIKEGFKWSPVKAYYRRCTKLDPSLQWEFRAEVSKRANHGSPIDQDVCVLITIRDPLGQANVYDEMVRSMNQVGWSPQDIRLRSRSRGRFR